MNKMLLGAFLTAVLLFSTAVGAPKSAIAAPSQAQIAQFDTDAAAQRHCPRDTVVWLNTKTGVYHEKGMRWYGRTKQGAYVCEKEADAAGDRDTRNGQ